MAEPRRDDSFFRILIFVLAGGIIGYTQIGPSSAPSVSKPGTASSPSDASDPSYKSPTELIGQFAGIAIPATAAARIVQPVEVAALRSAVETHMAGEPSTAHPRLN